MIPQFIHILIMSLIGIGVTIFSVSTIIEMKNLRIRNWIKPRYIVVLERIAFGCFGIVMLIAIIYAVTFTILYK